MSAHGNMDQKSCIYAPPKIILKLQNLFLKLTRPLKKTWQRITTCLHFQIMIMIPQVDLLPPKGPSAWCETTLIYPY